MSEWRWNHAAVTEGALQAAKDMAFAHGVAWEELSADTQRIYIGIATHKIKATK